MVPAAAAEAKDDSAGQVAEEDPDSERDEIARADRLPLFRMPHPRPPARQVPALQTHGLQRRQGSAAAQHQGMAGIREQAKKRDGYACTDCGVLEVKAGSRSNLEVHHVEAIEDGGAVFDLRNLKTVCTTCHPRGRVF
jgi:5-methylcytosine-specific restriction endonuclease McrA